MDTRNIIAAISLSAAVIILYSLFFAPTTEQIKMSKNEISKLSRNYKSTCSSRRGLFCGAGLSS